jgi:hypothetical protein
MQQTGRRIGDAYISRCTTAGMLFEYLQKKTDKEKLAKIVQEKRILDLPNVTLKDREVSDLHEDVELGRWKVIRAELRERYLPDYEFKTGEKTETRNYYGRKQTRVVSGQPLEKFLKKERPLKGPPLESTTRETKNSKGLSSRLKTDLETSPR